MVFTSAEARAMGVGAHRLGAGDAIRLLPGIWGRAGRTVLPRDLAAALCRSDSSVVICGPSAAELLGMPLPFEATARECQEFHASSRAHRRDVGFMRWHRLLLQPADVIGIGDMRLTSRLRTWGDLGTQLTVDRLVALADHLIRRPRPRLEGRRDPYAVRDELADMVARRRTARGNAALRSALALARAGSDSPAETAVRLALHRAGLPEPLLNAPAREGGVELGEPDLQWPEWRVCVEHDGRPHLTREQQDRDIRRTERRLECGWTEVRTVAEDLHRGGARAVRRVSRALRRHGWPG